MMRILFSIVSFVSIHTWAMGFNGLAGDFSVNGCIGTSSVAAIDYCQYDELKISNLANDQTLTRFDFLKNGVSLLSFNVKTSELPNESLSFDPNKNKTSLVSNENGIKSEISFEPIGENIFLKLSSQSSEIAYRFSLILKK